MHNLDVLRRTFGAAVLFLVAWFAAKHNWLDNVFGSLTQILCVVGVVVATLIIIWSIARHTPLHVIIASVVCVLITLLVEHVFDFGTAVGLLSVAAAGVFLWVFVILDLHTFRTWFSRPQTA